MKLLAFSDLHVDVDQARSLAERSADADVVVGAGDFASIHEGLERTLDPLREIERRLILVPGNNETEAELREACDGWANATVLHGEEARAESASNGDVFFGLGAGVPVTPWDWSFDLDEDEAARMLEPCPTGAILVVHSPPRGHCDVSGAGEHLGSTAILEAIESKSPRLAVCGHIHESWGAESRVGDTPVINLGPEGRMLEV